MSPRLALLSLSLLSVCLEALAMWVGSERALPRMAGRPLGGDASLSDTVWATATALVTYPTSPAALAVHGLGVGLLVWLVRRSPLLQRSSPDAVLILLFTGFMGLSGSIVALLAVAIGWVLPTPKLHEEVVEPDATGWESSGVLAGSAALEAASLCDVFRHGSLSQRRSAVALIAANFEPELAEALRMALRDEHNAIRVQAGMVMQQLEDDFVRQQRALEALTEDELADHGFAPDDVWLRLAKLHDKHAYTGLLDSRRTLEAHSKALRAYQAHLKRFPNDLQTIAAIGRLLIRAGQHELVADWLKQQVGAGLISGSIVMWYVEALYRSERYDAVGEVLAAYGDLLAGSLPSESNLRRVLALWRGRRREEPAGA